MLRDADIVCFANDWSTDPTSKHHLLTHFAEQNDVLWIEAAGMRRPNLGSSSDLKRIATKVKALTRPPRRMLPRLHAYAPPVLPLPGVPAATAINSWLYRSRLASAGRTLGFSGPPLMWVYGPHVAPLIRNLPRSFLLYHCVDRWSAFEGHDAAFMEACERELCERADLVIASAVDLAERCARYSKNVHYISHGVAHRHFATALESGDLPADVKNIPGPRVGFFGLIHEWVDIDLIGRLADALPYQFVLIGASNQDMSALLARPNVHHLGRKPFAELPAYSRGFDAAIVPFRRTELTLSVNPIKLREYAAAGLPIVSTGLPEVLRCREIVRIADTTEEWLRELPLAVQEGAAATWRQQQSHRVAPEDWGVVAGKISDLIVQSGFTGYSA